MTSEIHLFIVWSAAANALSSIVNEISTSLVIKDVYEVNWSEELFSDNLTRFYAQNLPEGSDKEQHIGRGSFYAIIVKDNAPKYDKRDTTKGISSVNTNIFDLKSKFRALTGGGHKIHATNNPTESVHDIWLLLGLQHGEISNAIDWNGEVKQYNKDLIGANGWLSIVELFKTLNILTNYIVLRNYECLPDSYHMELHGDIDLLVESVADVVLITGAKKVFPEAHRVHYKVNIDKQDVLFDFRFVGDDYYDINFERDLLSNRIYDERGFYIPNASHYFYSLMYHALIHKPSFSDEYSNRLVIMGKDISIDFDGVENSGVRLLRKYFYENEYILVKPVDGSVFFKDSLADFFLDRKFTVNREFLQIVDETEDASLFSAGIRSKCNTLSDLYHFSPAKANLLRPFASLLHGEVLELGAGCGTLTRYLGELNLSVTAVECSSIKANIARSRSRDLKNVCVITTLPENQKYDVVVIAGIKNNAEFLSSADDPFLDILSYAKSRLKSNGVLIVADDNLLSLRSFAADLTANGLGQYGDMPKFVAGRSFLRGKKEWVNVLQSLGFADSQLLSPVPSYIYPCSILAESGISDPVFDAAVFAWQGARRDVVLPSYVNFSLEMAWLDIFNNDLSLELCNSFLFCARLDEKLPAQTALAHHFSSDRRISYCKEVRFERVSEQNILVRYIPLASDASVLEENPKLAFTLPDDAEYLDGVPLSMEFIKLISLDGWDMRMIQSFFVKYINILMGFDGFPHLKLHELSKETILPGHFFDLAPHNIIMLKDGSPSIIDREWSLIDGIELGYLLFRSLQNLLGTVTYFGKSSEKIYTKDEFFNEVFIYFGFSLAAEDVIRYLNMESENQFYVTGRQLQNNELWQCKETLFTPNVFSLLEQKDRQISAFMLEVEKVSNLYEAQQAVLIDRDASIGLLQKKVDETSRWGEGLYSQVLIRDTEINNRSNSIKEITSWAESLHADVISRDSIILDLNEKLKEVSDWAKTLQEKTIKQEDDIELLGKKIVELNSEVSKVSEQEKIMQDNLLECSNELFEYKSKATKLTDDLLKLHEHEKVLIQEINTKEQINLSLSKQLKDALAGAQAIANQPDNVGLESADLKNELLAARKTIATLTEDVERATALYRSATADLLRVSEWGVGIEQSPINYAVKKYTLRLARGIYRRLPLSAGLKYKLRQLVRRETFGAVAADAAAEKIQSAVLNPVSGNIHGSVERDVFIFAVIDWHFRIQRPQHIAKGLARTGKRVFYFSNHFCDEATPGYQIEKLSPTLELYQVKLYVTGAPAIYFDSPTASAQAMLEKSMAVFMADYSCWSSVSVLQHAYWYELAKKIPNSIKTYDCMDHHEGFGNVPEKLISIEKEMLRDSDFVIVTSSWLKDFADAYNKNIVMVRNACEYEHFSTEPVEKYQDPQNRKIIGYYGAIAEWFDIPLIRAVAEKYPEYLILLVGSDTVGAQQQLTDLQNIVFTGEVPYSALPYYLYAFDVCLLPFQVISLTLATNPVKVYEYLSAGKPVVCVDLPEVSQFGGLVYKANSSQQFIEQISIALSKENNGLEIVNERKKFAASQTWAHRAEDISLALTKVVLPKVSVIVLTYNNLELTKACLDSIYKYSNYPNLEVIVVDNASSDDTPAYLREFKQSHPDAVIILNDKNLGFSAGNNVGLAAATGDYLVMLNNDTYVTPGWVLTLLNHLRFNDSIGIVGPVTNTIGNEAKIAIDYADMTEMHSYSRIYTLAHMGQRIFIPTVAFFCVMMPRRVYELVGPMDEKFGRGFFEDDDYCRRIEKINMNVACADDVFIHHHLSASFNKLGAEVKQKLFDENKVYYESKWGVWTPHKYRD